MRTAPEPFAREDAVAWADVCTRLEARMGAPVTDTLLHLSMDVNYTDALSMWVFAHDRWRLTRWTGLSVPVGKAALNHSRAFGLTDARERYSRYLYRMMAERVAG